MVPTLRGYGETLDPNVWFEVALGTQGCRSHSVSIKTGSLRLVLSSISHTKALQTPSSHVPDWMLRTGGGLFFCSGNPK